MKQARIILVLFTALFLASTAMGSTITIHDMNINNDETYTNSQDINVFFTVNPSDANICITTNDSNSNCSYDLNQDDSPYGGVDLTSGEGTKYIYLYAQHDNNYSDTNDSIMLDALQPDVVTYPANSVDYNTSSMDFDFNIMSDSDSEAIGSPLDADNAVIKVDGNVWEHTHMTITSITDGNRFQFPVNGLSEGDHNFNVDVNDYAGNNQESFGNFTIDTNAPADVNLDNSFETSWTNGEKPTFTFEAKELGSGLAHVGLSCSNTGPWEVGSISDENTYSDFNITSSSYDCNTEDGNKMIYGIVQDVAGNWSGLATTNVLYDNNAPMTPTGLSASAGTEEVDLFWDAVPDTDSNYSGIKGYKIYYSTGSVTKSSSSQNVANGRTSTSATVSGLTGGTEYNFKVASYDNVGNISGLSGSDSATPAASDSGDDTDSGDTPDFSDIDGDVTVKRGGSVVEYAKDEDVLTVEASFDDDIQNARIRYRYYNPYENITTLVGPEDDVDSLEDEITVSSGHEKICFWADGSDDDGAGVSTETDCVFFDDEEPEAEWAEDVNAMISGNADVFVEATDNEGIDNVKFYLDDVQVDTAEKDGNIYEGTIGTTAFDNGDYTLKAIVTDKAGNETTIEKEVAVDNYISPADAAQSAIDAAEEAKGVVDGLVKYFSEEGVVFPAEFTEKRGIADSLLELAKNMLDTNAEEAKEKAEEAEEKYSEINTSANFEEVPGQTDLYEYNIENLPGLLSALGLSGTQAEEVKSILSEAGAERRLQIVKVGKDENAIYQAKIEISFTNPTDSDQLKIVEFIPKEIAQSASQIYSDHNFIILQEDPVIEFNIDVASGASKTIAYNIGNLSEEDANEMIEENMVAKFSAPPAILKSETSTDNLKKGFDWALVLGIISVLVIIAIIGVAALYMMDKEQNPLGPKGKNTFMEKFNIEKLKEAFKKDKNKGETGKWAYKKK